MHVRASISTLRAAAGTCLLALMLGTTPPALAHEPVSTAFTYQGELAAAGATATGTFDLRFRLFDAAAGGLQVGSTLCSNDLVVENGRFSVSLDFGAAFAGEKRFLEIEVRQDAGQDCADASGYSALSPRQELTAAPSASFAQSAASLNGQSPSFYQNAANLTGTLPSSVLSGTYMGPLSLSNALNVFSGNGASITNLNATNISSGTLDAARMPSNWAAGGDLTGVFPNPTINPGAVMMRHLSSDVTSVLGTRGAALSLASRLSIDATLDSLATDGNIVCALDPAANTLLVYSTPSPMMPEIFAFGSATTGDAPRSVAVLGQFAYVVSAGSETLQAFDLFAPMGPAAMGSAQVHADPVSVVVSGTHAYVASGSGSVVQVFDLSNPVMPVFVTDVATSAGPASMVVSGTNLVVLCSASNTLQVFDISSPMSPLLVGSVATNFGARSLAVSGLHAYVLAEGTLEVFDITNTAAPVLTGTVFTGPQTTGLAVSDRYAFVASQGDSSVMMYDLSDPTAPVMVAGEYSMGFPMGLVSTGGGVVVSGIFPETLTYYKATATTTYDTGRAQFAGQVRASEFRGSGAQLFGLNASNISSGMLNPAQMPPIDASMIVSGVLDPARMPAVDAAAIQVGVLANERTTGTDATSPDTLVLRDASGSFSAGMITAELNGNAATATLATSATSATTAMNALNAANTTQLDGQPASFYTDASNIATGTLSDARLSSDVARLNSSQTFTGQVNFANAGNTFTGNGAGLTNLNGGRIDAGTLSRSSLTADVQGGIGKVAPDLSLAGSVAIGDTPSAVAVSGSFAYVVDTLTNTLQVIDISNPASSTFAGNAATGGRPSSVAVSGSHAYVVNSLSNTLQIFDISNPAAISLVGSASTDAFPNSVAVSGSFAYVANAGSDTVSVFNVSNPAAPTLAGSAATGAQPYSVAVSGSFVYLVNRASNSLQIFNISNPATPTLVGSVTTGSGPCSISVSGSFAYVVNHQSNTLQIFNISNPAAPALAGSAATGSTPFSVAVAGSFAYVADWQSGTLETFNIGSPSAPTLAGTVSTGMNPQAVAVSGSFAYVVSRNALQVFTTAPGLSFGTPLAPSVLAGVDGSGLTGLNAETLGGLPIAYFRNASSIISGVLENERTTGTDWNAPRSLVLRDSAGNFAAGTISATLNGNANSATTAGYAATAGDSSSLSGHPASFYTNASNLTAGILANARTTGTPLSTPSALVLRDASGNFSAGTITATLSGNAATATTATNATQLNGQTASFYTTASSITAGTLADARLSPNVALKDAANTFTSTGSTSFAGNLGIGTTTPNSQYSLQAVSTGDTQIALTGGPSSGGVIPPRTWAVQSSRVTSPQSQVTGSFQIIDRTAGASRLLIDTAGNVGVGALAPIQTLDVNGRMNVNSGVIQRGGSAVTTTSDLGLYSQVPGSFMRFVTSSGEFHWYADGGAGAADRMILFPNGNLSVAGSLAKAGGSFKIDHPLDPKNKYLYHSFVESPDMKNIYDGNVTTDADGYATITMPDYFEALNRDFRYQLTVINAEDTGLFPQAQVVRKLNQNQFTIRTSLPQVEVSWQVTGIRHDAWAEKNRIPNSVDKVGAEKGAYLHPDAFNEPAGASQQNPISASH